MKKNTMMVNTLLAVVLGVALLVAKISKTYMPYLVFPAMDIIAVVGITLIVLVLEYYLVGRVKRAWMLQIIFAGLTFFGVGMAAGVAGVGIMTFVTSAVAFGVLAFAFDSMVARLEVTTDHKLAVIPTAFVLYLACQCFMGMF